MTDKVFSFVTADNVFSAVATLAGEGGYEFSPLPRIASTLGIRGPKGKARVGVLLRKLVKEKRLEVRVESGTRAVEWLRKAPYRFNTYRPVRPTTTGGIT